MTNKNDPVLDSEKWIIEALKQIDSLTKKVLARIEQYTNSNYKRSKHDMLDDAPNYRIGDTCLRCRHSKRIPDEDNSLISQSYCTHYGAEVAEFTVCDDFE